MWEQITEYLSDPHLVARIQHLFGVEIHRNDNLEAEKKKVEREEYDFSEKIVDEKKNGVNIVNIYLNRYLANEKSSSDEELSRKEILPKQKVYDSSSGEITATSDSESQKFRIKNHFWYYLFIFGTELGDEIFYCSFIPFWFWNIDGAVGRRVVLVWATVMTIGQVLKDILCWPRPACPPAARLQSKWSQEYGMPSTHAMVGVSIPFSIVLFTMNRYIYSLPVGILIATMWCALICTSRLYLGMHTVLDLIVGLILAIALMIPLVPLVDTTDYYFLTNGWALLVLIAITIATVIYYPRSDRWTPTRGDTTMVVSVTSGVHVGAWLNYKIGALSASPLPPPYNIIWPSYPMLGRTVLRTILGFSCVIATRAFCKTFSYATMCAILRVNSKELKNSENSLENRNKVLVDLVYKYITCFMIGFNTVYFLPNVFTMIGIERPTFYTEI